MEVEIIEELYSSDPIKQLSGVQKLNQFWINQGKDPNIFFSAITRCLQDTESKPARLLLYNVLKSCNSTQNDWTSVISTIVKDLNNDDVEIVIGILKVLPHVSTILIELLMLGNCDFGPLVRHSNQSIRRSALDILMTLLFYRKAMMIQYKSFVTTGWELIVDRLLDEQQPSVYQSAFNAVSTLFSEISRSVSHTDEYDNGIQRRQQMATYGDFVSSRLVDHFDLLLQRFDLIDLSQRHVGVNTLTYLADSISRVAGVPYWPTSEVPKLTPHKYKQLSTPQNIVLVLVSQLQQLLGSTNDALVFASGKAILDLLLTQQNQQNDTWVGPVLTAFVGLLRREGITLNPLPILLAVMGVLPMLNDEMLLCTLTKIFPSIKTVTDSNQRVSYLIRTFELIIDRHVSSNGKCNLFTPLVTDQNIVLALQDEQGSFREEIVVSMIASHHNILTKYTNNQQQPQQQQSQKNIMFSLIQVALNITEVCLKSVLWGSVERISAIEYSIRFIDWLCRVVIKPPGTATTSSSNNNSPATSPANVSPTTSGSNVSLSDSSSNASSTNFDSMLTSQISQKLLQLLRNDLLDVIVMIPSDAICLQSLFLVCNHLLKTSSNKLYEQSDCSLIVGLLRKRFLHLDNQVKLVQFTGSLRDMVMGTTQYSKASQQPLASLSTIWLGSLECLYLLGLNVPSAESAVIRTLDDLINTYPSNKAVVQRSKFIKKVLSEGEKVHNEPGFQSQLVDFNYCLPIESIENPLSLKNASDIFSYECKKAITGLAGTNYGASIHDRPTRETTLVSGYCDPVWVEISHTAHPTLHTITLSVSVTNVIHFAIKNISIVVGLGGHLEFPLPLTNAKHFIPKLLPEKSYTFELPLSVTGIDHNSVTFTVYYGYPSGMIEIDHGVSKRSNTSSSSFNLSTSNSSVSSQQLLSQSQQQQQQQQNIQQQQQSNMSSPQSINVLNSTSNNNSNNIVSPQQSTNVINSTANNNVSPSSTSPNIINSSSSPSTTGITTTTLSSNTSTTTAVPIHMAPIETRCLDYSFDWNQFLVPFKYNKHQFLQQWPRFESSFIVDAIFEGYNLNSNSIDQCLLNYPFHNVHSTYFDDSSFQFAYSSSTWFNDQLCFIVSGMNKTDTSSDPNRKVIQARFEFKSSNPNVLASFQNILDLWLHKIPRPTDTFLARQQSPGEVSLFSINTVNQQQQQQQKSKQSIETELSLLNQWKEQKSKLMELNNLKSQSIIEQEFY